MRVSVGIRVSLGVRIKTRVRVRVKVSAKLRAKIRPKVGLIISKAKSVGKVEVGLWVGKIEVRLRIWDQKARYCSCRSFHNCSLE